MQKNKLNKKNIFFKKLFVIIVANNHAKYKFIIITRYIKDFVPKKLQFGDVFVTSRALVGKQNDNSPFSAVAERAVWQADCQSVARWLAPQGLAVAALDLFKLVFAVAKPNGFAVGQLHRATSVGPAGGKFVSNTSAGRTRRE